MAAKEDTGKREYVRSGGASLNLVVSFVAKRQMAAKEETGKREYVRSGGASLNLMR
jgi:hypothetical protein